MLFLKKNTHVRVDRVQEGVQENQTDKDQRGSLKNPLQWVSKGLQVAGEQEESKISWQDFTNYKSARRMKKKP